MTEEVAVDTHLDHRTQSALAHWKPGWDWWHWATLTQGRRTVDGVAGLESDIVGEGLRASPGDALDSLQVQVDTETDGLGVGVHSKEGRSINEPGKPTLKTVADAARVHVSTVSRALNPQEAHLIGADTVRKIQRIADELGYEPNHWARSLRTRRTMTLGLVLPLLTDSVLAQMFEAAEEAARKHGYHALTASTGDREGDEQRLIDGLLERRVDGLILATPLLEDEAVDKLRERGVPYQLMNRRSGDHPTVRGDDELGGYLATAHLLARGHRRIGVVAGSLSTSTATDRLAGFKRACKEAGVDVDESLVVPSSFTAHGGLAAGQQILGRPERPTAVFAVNDATAIGVMAAAREFGLRIPEDLAIVGYNNTAMSSMLPIPLSSVGVPLNEIGTLAVTCLLEQIQGKPPRSVMLSPVLVVRTSSNIDRFA